MKDSWKPHKKTIVIIVGLFALSTFFVWLNQDKEIFSLLSQDDPTTASAEDLSSKDTDGDGVRDWEEFLWDLDPNKKDTNSNGITDDKELEAKKVALRGTSTPETSTASSTFTDAFSKEFFVAFTALKQSGNLTKANIDKLSQQSLAALTQTSIKDKYTKKDLILASSTPESKITYRNAIQATGDGLSIKTLGTELDLLYKAINKPKSEKLVTDLLKIEKIYLTLAERTIAVPAPSVIQNSHLKLANNYYALGTAVAGLAELYNDPALSVVYLGQYQKAIEALPTTMSTLKKYMQ